MIEINREPVSKGEITSLSKIQLIIFLLQQTLMQVREFVNIRRILNK